MFYSLLYEWKLHYLSTAFTNVKLLAENEKKNEKIFVYMAIWKLLIAFCHKILYFSKNFWFWKYLKNNFLTKKLCLVYPMKQIGFHANVWQMKEMFKYFMTFSMVSCIEF